MENAAQAFLRHLEVEKNASVHTVRNYRSDLAQFMAYLARNRRSQDLSCVEYRQIRAYLAELHGRDLAPAELARHLKLPLGETLALIAEAELDGWICRRPGGALASMENLRAN